MLLKRLTHVILANNNKLATKSKQLIIVRTNFSVNEIGKRDNKNVYDYKKKAYGVLDHYFDSTLARLTDNSLIITVDGNFGSGKTNFAKELASKIDFHYAREIDLDNMLYIKNGVNHREINNEICGDNERFRINTLEEWHQNPSFKRTAQLQEKYYTCRWWQYRTALLHLFSTGQGVVIERSPWSDLVIAQALFEHNYLSSQAWNYYKKELHALTVCELWKPHVCIYIDRPVDECLSNIRKNGKKFEKESKLYSKEFLQTVERIYKRDFQAKFKNDSYLLNYDAKDFVMDEVINDLELLNLDDDKKFENWRVRKEIQINEYRGKLANTKYCDFAFEQCIGYTKVPEILLDGADLYEHRKAINAHPALRYDAGYSPEKDGAFKVMFGGLFKKKDLKVDWL